jgi:hypothetical protein
MKIVSLASILGVTSAYNVSRQPNKVHCKLTANDEVKSVKYNGKTVKASRNAGDADYKWESTTYSFSEVEGASLTVQVEDKTWNGSGRRQVRNDKTGAFSMKCTAKDGSSWNGFKSNTDECWNGNPHGDVGLCETSKKLSFDGKSKADQVLTEHKIWHCGKNEQVAKATIKCKPDTDAPTAQPTTKSPTKSPTKKPTDSPTLSPTEKCNPGNCDKWTCKDWCECFDEAKTEAYDQKESCKDDGEETCMCFQHDDDETPQEVIANSDRHTKMNYRQFQHHKVVCGRHNPRQCHEQDKIETDLTALHEVRCCTDGKPTPAVPGMKNCASPHSPGPSPQNGNVLPGIPGVWGMSKVGYEGDKCVHAATFVGAQAICAAIDGGRLCTEYEIKNECTSYTGCNHDADLIWIQPHMQGYDGTTPRAYDNGRSNGGVASTSYRHGLNAHGGYYQHCAALDKPIIETQCQGLTEAGKTYDTSAKCEKFCCEDEDCETWEFHAVHGCWVSDKVCKHSGVTKRSDGAWVGKSPGWHGYSSMYGITL